MRFLLAAMLLAATATAQVLIPCKCFPDEGFTAGYTPCGEVVVTFGPAHVHGGCPRDEETGDCDTTTSHGCVFPEVTFTFVEASSPPACCETATAEVGTSVYNLVNGEPDMEHPIFQGTSGPYSLDDPVVGPYGTACGTVVFMSFFIKGCTPEYAGTQVLYCKGCGER